MSNIELFCGCLKYHNSFFLKEKHFKSKYMKHLALLPLTFAGLSDFWAVRISPDFGLVMVNHPCSSLCSTNHFCTSLFFVSKDSKSTTEPDFGVKLSIPNTLDEFLVSITPSVPWGGNVHWALLNCQIPPLFSSLESFVNFHNWSENILSNYQQ